ncbi:MAG: hypothetical protein DMF63_11225 [Acidobacteria bacterium]|nr:MAG: hypothetical protein DMF63_11225 [Acidobacteriota bacterium]
MLTFVIAVISVSAASVTVFAQGGFFGAIYTTLGDGQTVNQNVYPNKPAVYLNGGPQNPNAHGLPDGTYYFQVTNPSGSVLLSTDLANCRQEMVVAGKMAGGTGPCPHPNATVNDANGSRGVQLVPFNDTPNAGGEYKVWLIRQSSTTTVAADGIHINFLPSNAKTDNFKVLNFCQQNPNDPTCQELGTVTISGHKFYDANASTVNENEAPVENIGIHVLIWHPGSDPSTAPADEDAVVQTDANGNWTFGPVPAGSAYKVDEILPDPCPDGSYWIQTAPAADSEGFQGYTGTAFQNVTGLDFGDICFTDGTGGFTLGYWSNKNGQKRMETGPITDVYVFYADGTPDQNMNCGSSGANGINCDLAFLRRFNLRNTSSVKNNPNGLDFDPTSYTQFRTWLLSGNAINMAYMLSVQLSATSLDVRHQTLSDTTVVDARGVCNSNGTCLGLVTIGEVRRLANESLGNNGFTVTGDPHREDQEVLKNFLDSVNNNRLAFGNTSPCNVCYITK